MIHWGQFLPNDPECITSKRKLSHVKDAFLKTPSDVWLMPSFFLVSHQSEGDLHLFPHLFCSVLTVDRGTILKFYFKAIFSFQNKTSPLENFMFNSMSFQYFKLSVHSVIMRNWPCDFLTTRNKGWATHVILNFRAATFKKVKETGEINCNNIFHWTTGNHLK